MRTTLNVLAMNSIRLFFFLFFAAANGHKNHGRPNGTFCYLAAALAEAAHPGSKSLVCEKKKRQLLTGRSSPLGENSSEAIGISCESVCVLHITFDNNDERLAQNRFLNLFISLRYFAYSLNALRMLV